MSGGLRFTVDLPTHRTLDSGVWDNVDYFETKEEAIAFVAKEFGGGEEGRVCLVSEMPEEDEE